MPEGNAKKINIYNIYFLCFKVHDCKFLLEIKNAESKGFYRESEVQGENGIIMNMKLK